MTAPRVARCATILCCLLTATFLPTPCLLASEDTLPLLDYRHESWFLPQTPGVTAGPMAGLFNPGAAALTDRAGFDFWLDDRSGKLDLDNFGFALGRNLNLAMNRSTYRLAERDVRVDDWQLGLAGGDRGGSIGLAYRWSGGDTETLQRESALVLGLVRRPARWLSLGASRAQSLGVNAAQNIIDLGLRPVGDRLTLFADWTADDDQSFFADGAWGAGVEVRPVDGVHVGLRARDRADGDVAFTALIGFTGRTDGVSALPLYDGDDDGDSGAVLTTYLMRHQPSRAGDDLLAGWFDKKPRYFALDLQNKRLTYQKYRLFDDERVAWLDLLNLLDGLRDDDGVDIIALNLAGFRARPSLAWELRGKLQELQNLGKEVHVYADRLGLTGFFLASVADHLVLDPQGMIMAPGLSLTRSYLKGTLAKLGIGFQEHRYFKYKSAAETLSRDHMSDADREQRQRVVDVLYETLRDGIAAGRDDAATQIDHVIDELAYLTTAEAIDSGWVDASGRWDDLLKALREERHARPTPVPNSVRRTYWDECWGRPPRIPVVYAVGECAMDSGIKGRDTSAYLRRLADDPTVAAVVLRVDSPGGDPLPSDLVTAAVRQLKEAGKPVVVSQGDVAASGGYWISMDGSRILTTPLTITGSIGVISGWVWDDGVAEKVGVTADDVHRGRRADLFSNVNLPLVGSLPRRAMNDEELARVEHITRGMYDQFVGTVATSRGLEPTAVGEMAQGRVWMGGDAIELGLCDDFGGLGDAIAEARRLAGIPDGGEIELAEYPPRPWIRWPSFGPQLPDLFGLNDRVGRWFMALTGKGAPTPAALVAVPEPWDTLGLSTLESRYLQSVMRDPGQPLLLVTPDVVPEGWRQLD